MGAVENNLANIKVSIPLGLIVAVTGVSGAGKSTLINQILYPALARSLHNSTLEVGKHKNIKGLAHSIVRGLRRADVRTHRNIHPDVACSAREHRSDKKADCCRPVEGEAENNEQRNANEANGRVLAVQIGACSFLDRACNFLRLCVA